MILVFLLIRFNSQFSRETGVPFRGASGADAALVYNDRFRFSTWSSLSLELSKS